MSLHLGTISFRGVMRLVVCCTMAIAVLAHAESRIAGKEAQRRDVTTFNRYYLTGPTGVEKVLAAHDLSGGSWGVSGWFEYDIDIGDEGWYQLLVEGTTNEVKFIFDPDERGNAQPGYRFVGGEGSRPGKVGNVWLTKARHRLRIQRYFWTGFRKLTAFELRRSDGSLPNSISVSLPGDGRIFARGRCPELEIASGGLARPGRLDIRETDTFTAATLRSYSVDVPAGNMPVRKKLALSCNEDGFRTLKIFESGSETNSTALDSLNYEIVDTHAPARLPSIRPPGKVVDIDCTARAPDYASGSTRVVSLPNGGYRESGDTGLTRYQRAPQVARKLLPEPSWFAYTLEGLAPQQRYRIEVDYPDDALRTFGIVLREARPLQYPVAIGVDTGGEFPLGGGMQTQSMIVWPRVVSPRLTFLTAHDGMRAACARIRVYRADAPEPAAPDSPTGRQFVFWYEEGENYASLFGPKDEDARGQRAAVERWAEAATSVGGSTLMPTVAVYSSVLYPSRYNVAFSRLDDDRLKRLLLVAEKYGLKVVPELSPRADELAFGRTDGTRPPGNLAISREGKTDFFAKDGKTRTFPPHYNALDRENQDWYIAMVGELAERYKDSTALEGISLRYMAWANPALNNLVDLDWGYDDATIAHYKEDTGSGVPLGRSDDPQRYAARHAWLTGRERHAWIEWRCKAIADLIRRVRDRIRQARPDLKLYLNVFGPQAVYTGSLDGSDSSLTTKLREIGLDPALLNAIDGVVLINSAFSYGRREIDGSLHGERDMLLDPAALDALRKPGEGGRFISASQYLEATDTIVPPESLGFPVDTKKTWTSAVTNPPGRLALERYAVELATTDAVMLGDGGNGYVFGPPVVRDFMSTFRRLPARRFDDRPDAIDPVTVRSYVGDDAYYFYAVNRERYPVEVAISLDNAATVLALGEEKPLRIPDSRLRLKLRAYELLAFKAAANARIRSVDITPPTEEKERVARQIDAVERLADLSPWQTLLKRGPSEQERNLLASAARKSRQALDSGWLWRARTILEHSTLLAIYRQTGCYPPGLLAGNGDHTRCPD